MTSSTSQTTRLRMVMRQEWLLMRVDRGLWAVGLLFLLLIAYALGNGIHQTSSRERAQVAVAAADAAARAAQLALLEDILAEAAQPSPFANPADPSRMAGGYGAQHAILPIAPLGAVALGQSDLFPSQFKVSNQSRVGFLNPSDIENPWHMLSGHFDLAFIIVYLLPLLIFAVSYNLVSGERESGTLRLLMSQPLRLGTLLAGKLTVRAAALLTPAVLLPVLVLLVAQWVGIMGQGVDLVDSIGWWALLVGCYALFWFSLVVAVNAFGASSATNAMMLVIAWVVLVLVAPVLLNLLVMQVSPAPSRTELATRTRALTAQAMQRHAALLQTDYQHVGKGAILLPRDGKIEISGRALGQYRVERDLDQAIAPELANFQTQQARQQALLGKLAILSPAALAYEGMTALGGTGARRHMSFVSQTTDFHKAWTGYFYPRIEAGTALTPVDFARIPSFSWREEPASLVRRQAATAVLQLLIPALLLLALSVWRFRRLTVQ